jgi:hypothetical protein
MPAGPAPTIITSYFTGTSSLGTQNYMQQVTYICSRKPPKAKFDTFDRWTCAFLGLYLKNVYYSKTSLLNLRKKCGIKLAFVLIFCVRKAAL